MSNENLKIISTTIRPDPNPTKRPEFITIERDRPDGTTEHLKYRLMHIKKVK